MLLQLAALCRYRFVAPLLAVAFLAAGQALAAPGDLDRDFGGFGNDGRISTLGFTVQAMTIDPQGRLVLVGEREGTFYLQRRSGPGFLEVETASTIIVGSQMSAVARAVAIAPDGKIVLAGSVTKAGGERDFAVARFHDNLTLDASFAGDGTQLSDFDDRNDDAYAVAVQADLKIVVAGAAVVKGLIYTDEDWAVERFHENGTLDNTFNGNGKWTFDSEATHNRAYAVAIQDDQKIVVAGDVYTGNLGGNHDFSVIRLTTTGSMDNSFSGDGRVDIGFGEHEGARALALDPFDGSMIVAGGGYYEADQFHVARLLANGTLDPSFGDAGRQVPAVNGLATAHAAFVQPDHKTVLAGRAFFVDGPDQFVLMRLSADGSLDPTFGDGGRVFTEFGVQSTGAIGLGMRFDGSFIAAGGIQAAGYRPDGALDAGGVVDFLFHPDHTGAEATALHVGEDGKLIAAGKVYLYDGYDVAHVRFQQDYSLGGDPTFGTETPQNGMSLVGGGGSREIRAVATRTDGTTAYVGQLYFDNYNVLVGRLKSDGTADGTCSGVGYNSTDYGFGDDSAVSIAVAGTKVLAAGTVAGPTGSDFGLVRFAENCSVDDAGAAVAQEYKFRFDLGGQDLLGAMVLQGGRPVLAGTSADNVVVVRVRQNVLTGAVTLDPNFGTAGRTTINLGDGEVVTGLATQSDGKLIISGWVAIGGGSNFFVARTSAEGILDEDFGVGGLAYASFHASDFAQALAVRDDDKIAVVGCTSTTSGSVFAVAQFTASGALDTSFSSDGKATVRTGPSGEECAHAVTYLGHDRLVVGGYTSVFGIRQFVLAAFESDMVRECGDANEDGDVTATDALIALRTAVQSASCDLCVCDTNGSGSITASDALLILRAAVGQMVTMQCAGC